MYKQIISLFMLVLHGCRSYLFDLRKLCRFFYALSFGIFIFMDAMFRGMSRFLWLVSFVSLVDCLDRLLWDSVPARNLFMCHRIAISRRSLRITRHRLFILVACAILLHGSIPLLQFHLCLIFDGFELVDLLYMLLSVRLVCSLAVST